MSEMDRVMGSYVKYTEIVDNIKQKIQNNIFKSDELLPSEKELCLEYNVSRRTVRRAIDELVEAGFLYTVPGKGTFVRVLNRDSYEMNMKFESMIYKGFDKTCCFLFQGGKSVNVRVEAGIKGADGADLPLTIDGDAPVMTYEVGRNWSLSEDGYYYYALPVTPGESTELLFDTVSFAPEMGNEYQDCTANIVISAQAVQTANNGQTVLEAQGWSENEEVAR